MTKELEETNNDLQQAIDQNRKINHKRNDKIENDTQTIREQQNLIISLKKVNKAQDQKLEDQNNLIQQIKNKLNNHDKSLERLKG